VLPRVLLDWNCRKHCTNSATQGTTEVNIWEDIITGIKYYTAFNHGKKSLVVSFRGTLTPASLLVDAAFAQAKYTGHPGAPEDAQVHAGFQYAYNRVAPKLRDLVRSMSRKMNADYTVDVTGHSLGGAIACLCALDFAAQKMFNPSQIRLFTYGQPRTGNPVFAGFVSSFGFKALTRTTANDDLIPHMPPWLTGYAHHRGEVWMEGWWFENEDGGFIDWLKGKIRDTVGLERRVTTCKDQYCEDSGCSNREPPFLNILSHLRYWNITFGPWC